MEYLGNWKFWVAVIVVAVAVHFAVNVVLPKLSGGG